MNPELLKRLDPIARRFGFYLSYTLDESEFIGETDIDTANVFNEPENMNPPFVMEHDLYQYLEWIGYEQNATFAGISLVAAKQHPKTGRVHDVSMRKIDPENERKQYHLHYWLERSGGVDTVQIASHREYRPDFKRVADESYSEMYDRLRTHYRPEYGEDYERGVMCDELESLVD